MHFDVLQEIIETTVHDELLQLYIFKLELEKLLENNNIIIKNFYQVILLQQESYFFNPSQARTFFLSLIEYLVSFFLQSAIHP